MKGPMEAGHIEFRSACV